MAFPTYALPILFSSTCKFMNRVGPISPFSALTPILPVKFHTYSHIYQQCALQKVLPTGKQAHARMIVSGFHPTVFVTNCLIQMYIECDILDSAFKVFDRMPQRDTVSWNAMISGFAGRGQLERAKWAFDSMPRKDAVSWNSFMSCYSKNGELRECVSVFMRMAEQSVAFDCTTFAIILKVCSLLNEYYLGFQLHGLAVKNGFDHDVVTATALVDMYAKCEKLDDSLQFFYEMPQKNWVSWSAVIAGCVQNNELIGGVELFKEMQRQGVNRSQSTYASIFKACAALRTVRIGSQVHAHAVKSEFCKDVIVGTATLDMYAKCGNLLDARRLFNSLPTHNLQSYNAIIVGYAQSDRGIEALQLFQLLRRTHLGFDEITLSGAFSSCALVKGIFEGRQVHGLSVKSGFASNTCVANAILDMYGKCGALNAACHVFDGMVIRDAVSWNAIIAAYEQNGNEEATLELFLSMLRSSMEPDEFTYGSVLKACGGTRAVNCGLEIHNRIIKSGMGLNLFVGGALVDMYCKSGMMEEAEKLHNRMEGPVMVSWNSIISGYASAEQSEEAQKFFSYMLEMGVTPDNFTYATVLDTCANLATAGLGQQIHGQIIKQELQTDVYIASTLVDMYSKCGNMQDSRLIFEQAPKRDFVTWNAMICGYAYHGHGEEALEIFDKMQLANVKPNHATFVAVLRACGHMGYVKKGFHYFYSMSADHGLDPQLEHYACLVDIMGRSGQIREALKFISEMPFAPDDVIWRTLLSTCKIHGNVEVAEKAVSSILQLDPQDSSCCILLCNIYSEAGMWREVSELRKMMRYNGLKKEPGCSWIEVKDEVHTFLVGDKVHPRGKDIYERLNVLIDEMMLVGYLPEADYLPDVESEEGNQQQAELSAQPKGSIPSAPKARKLGMDQHRSQVIR